MVSLFKSPHIGGSGVTFSCQFHFVAAAALMPIEVADRAGDATPWKMAMTFCHSAPDALAM